MTLVVAEARDGEVWIVADTAITDPLAGTRERINTPKILRLSRDSMVAFAGNPGLAKRVINSVLSVPPGKSVMQMLLKGHIENEHLDFAYAYLDGGRAKLIRVSGGKAVPVPTLHIGSLRSDDSNTFAMVMLSTMLHQRCTH